MNLRKTDCGSFTSPVFPSTTDILVLPDEPFPVTGAEGVAIAEGFFSQNLEPLRDHTKILVATLPGTHQSDFLPHPSEMISKLCPRWRETDIVYTPGLHSPLDVLLASCSPWREVPPNFPWRKVYLWRFTWRLHWVCSRVPCLSNDTLSVCLRYSTVLYCRHSLLSLARLTG